MDIVEKFIAAAKARSQSVVLPEGGDERVLAAARRLRDEALARPVLLGQPGAVAALADRLTGFF